MRKKINEKMFIYLLVLYLTYFGIINANEENKTHTPDDDRARLMKDIFLIPVGLTFRTGKVHEKLLLLANMDVQHYDFQDVNGVFNFVAVLNVRWHDPRLVWDAKKYNNMSHIIVSQKHVWVPDLEVYENFPDKFFRMHREGFVTVRSDGTVFWSDTIYVHMFCQNEVQRWPYDKYYCTMKLGSWVYHGDEIDFIQNNINSSMSFSQIDMKHMPFKLVNFTAVHESMIYSCCVEPYINIGYYLEFERVSSLEFMLKMNAICVVLLTLLSLLIEPQRSEKLWLNILSFALTTWELIYLLDNIQCKIEVAGIVKFFCATLIMITFAQIVAVFSLFLTRSHLKWSLPYQIEHLLTNPWLAHLIPASADDKYKNQRRNNLSSMAQFEELTCDKSNLISSNQLMNDWSRFAVLIQRLIFILYVLLFVILSTVYFV